MRVIKDRIWTWLVPDAPRDIDPETWVRRGGKWIVFDSLPRIREIAEEIAGHIDAGTVESAKYWNGDPSAINVYSLDRDRMKTREILKNAGARSIMMVWEYDYAWGKNIRRPLTFAYSWFSKFRTIVQSYGVFGSIGLALTVLGPQRKKRG